MDWTSHDLVSFLLMLDAGKDIEKRKVAGLILVSRDWCWDDFIPMNDPLSGWVLETLAKWVVKGDSAPTPLKAAANKLKTAETATETVEAITA
jgi:hypothetical protein